MILKKKLIIVLYLLFLLEIGKKKLQKIQFSTG